MTKKKLTEVRNKLGAAWAGATIAFLGTMMPVYAAGGTTEGTVKSVWDTSFQNVTPLIMMVFNVALLVVAAFLINAAVRAYSDYKARGDVSWGPIIVLFVVLALLLVLRNNNGDLLWKLVGLK